MNVTLIVNDEGIIYGAGKTKDAAIMDFNDYMSNCGEPWINLTEEDFGLPYNNPEHPRGHDCNAYEIIEANVNVASISSIDANTDYVEL